MAINESLSFNSDYIYSQNPAELKKQLASLGVHRFDTFMYTKLSKEEQITALKYTISSLLENVSKPKSAIDPIEHKKISLNHSQELKDIAQQHILNASITNQKKLANSDSNCFLASESLLRINNKTN